MLYLETQASLADTPPDIDTAKEQLEAAAESYKMAGMRAYADVC